MHHFESLFIYLFLVLKKVVAFKTLCFFRPRGPQEENEDDLEIEQERMFRHSKQFAQLFKVKSESQVGIL